MKFTCSKSKLLEGVQIVSRAVPNKTTLDIMQYIMVEADDNFVKMTANDTDMGIETIIEANVEKPGKVALEARIFLDIVRKLPDNDVLIQTDERFQTQIVCENAKFNIIGKEGEDFVYLPGVEKSDSVEISQYTLKEVIRQTIFSINENDNNKQIGGECFEIKEDLLRVVALDGHRISIRRIGLKKSYTGKKVIIPGKALNEISKIVPGDADKDVTIYFMDNHVAFEFDSTLMVARLIEGDYFPIDQMLSSDYETKIHIHKQSFLNCIDRATLLVKEGDKKPVIMNITDENLQLKINSTIGSMNESIAINKTGKDILIGFNPKFLIDALRVIEDEEIDIYLVNSKSPCYIKDSDGKYIYMILPVNFTTVS